MPDQPTGPRFPDPGDLSGVFDDFPLDAGLRELYLRLRLDGAVWRSQQPEDDARLLAYAVELAAEAPAFVTIPTFDEPRPAPVTRDLRARGRPWRHALLGDARVAIVAALVVALVSVTLLQISPLARRSKEPGVTSGVQFTPTPGVTVTIQATPSQTAPATSQTPGASHSGGAGNGGTTPVPPGYPTPATTMGGSPTATTSAGPDKATLVSYTPTALDSTSYSWTQVSVTLLNSGVTTWDSSQGYKFQCYQYCWSGWYSSTTSFLVAPGQTYTFVGNMLPAPNSLYYRVDNSVWRMSSPTAGGFGDAAVVTVVEHGWDQSTVFAESSPSCLSDGSSWSRQGATGTVTCGGSGLALAQGGTGGIITTLVSTPNGYNYTQYMVKVHVHFTTTSAYTYAGVVLSIASTASSGAQTTFMVSPAGYYCESMNVVPNCNPGGAITAMPASSDFDIVVTVSNPSVFSAMANGSYGWEGGFRGGGATGLIETTAAGSTDAAYFSNYQLYQYK